MSTQPAIVDELVDDIPNQNSESFDEVRKLYAEEGRSARNLLIWNVPLEESEMLDRVAVRVRKPPLSPRPVNNSRMSECARSGKRSPLSRRGKSRIRSASVGRDPKQDFKARYWAFLFENLRRAVDEVYDMCEADEIIAECKEAIMVLDNYTKDFHSLIEWINLKREYDNTPLSNRPTSLTWEIRRPSSRSNLFIAAFDSVCNPNVQRALKFDSDSDTLCPSKLVSSSSQTEDAPSTNEEEIVKSTDYLSSTVLADSTTSNSAILTLDKVPSSATGSLNTSRPTSTTKSGSSTSPTISTTTLSSTSTTSIATRPTSSIGGIKVSPSSTGASKPAVSSVVASSGVRIAPRSGGKVSGSTVSVTGVTKTRTTPATSPPTDRETITRTGPNQLRPTVKAAVVQPALVSTTKAPNASHVTAGASTVKGSGKTSTPSTVVPTAAKAVGCASFDARSGSTSSLCSTSSSSQSWADRVRGATAMTLPLSKSPSVDRSRVAVVSMTATSATPPAQLNVRKEKTVQKESPAEPEVMSVVAAVAIAAKVDEDSDGWETVQRVRSKKGASPPHKLSPVVAVASAAAANTAVRSNSIGGFEMYGSGERRDQQKGDSRTAGLSKVNVGAPATNSATGAISRRPKDVPTPSKSLPSLHIDNNGHSETKAANRGGRTSGGGGGGGRPSTGTSVNECPQGKRVSTSRRDIASVSAQSKNVPKSSAAVGITKSSSLEKKAEIVKCLEKNGSCQSLQSDILEPLVTSEDEGSIPLFDDDDADDEAGIHSETPTTEDDLSLPDHLPPLWCDRMDMLESEMRPPGRVLQIHEKLSSPSRRRSPSESIRRHEEKQAKAQELRERLKEEKAQRWKEITKKLEEKRQRKEDIAQQRRMVMESKLQKAEEKRRIQLQLIIRKAHDEEEKVNEIAFINSLEAQNKRHDVMSRIQGHEARLQDLQEERQRRLEEKAAKEAAAEDRRKILEAERQARLLVMQTRRKEKECKIEKIHLEKEKERQELAREKARDREERLSALQAAQQTVVEELQKKIQQKQEESARRHDENIEQIRQKALELSILRGSGVTDDAPRLILYETKKLCSLCNVLIGSEVYLLSHLRGKKHRQVIRDHHNGTDPSIEELELYNLKHIINAPADKIDPLIAQDKERQKALKKRCKKLRQRMTTKGNEYGNLETKKMPTFESHLKFKFQKCMRDMTRCFQASISGPWPANMVLSLDRAMGEIARMLDRKGQCQKPADIDQLAFRCLNGFHTLHQVLNVILNGTPELNTVIPSRTLINACHLYQLVCQSNRDNCQHLLQSNKLTALLDLLTHRLNLLVPDNYSHLFAGIGINIITTLPVDNVASALMHLIATILENLHGDDEDCPTVGGSGQSTPKSEAAVTSTTNVASAAVLNFWIQDTVSYAVSVGVVDKLSQYFNNIRGPIDSEPSVAEFVQQGMALLLSLTKLLSHRNKNIFEKPRTEDKTQLIATLKITELVGTVSLLYGMLLHAGAPSRSHTPPPLLSTTTLAVADSALYMLNHFAVLDLASFQSVVGGEGISLEFRHIVSYLLWYCNHWPNDHLLHELILSVGYLVALNPDNQNLMQAGYTPTVLQQLCLLPFQYFSDTTLVAVLFPTLIACCFLHEHNAAILEQEVSCDLLGHYIEEKSLDLDHAPLPKKDKVYCPYLTEWRWQFASRFPGSKWAEALAFYRAHT